MNSDITIRHKLRPGDMGWIIHLHGTLYAAEQGYGVDFESYVAGAFHQFWKQYDPERDALWICEDQGRIVGFLLLMHHDPVTAQLRFFLLLPQYRNQGLGKKLMQLFLQFLQQKGYRHAFLWTAAGLEPAAALYRSAGFVLTEEKESEQFGKKLVEQRYDLHLP